MSTIDKIPEINEECCKSPLKCKVMEGDSTSTWLRNFFIDFK